ncbi:MAG: MFS transporter [Acidobacteriaceae bacterium]|nr:MFS transporter [Acidobacteriaceae bacterium]
MSSTAPSNLRAQTSRSTIGNFRWMICALLLYATTVNYMDRLTLSILQPVIARDLHWNNTEYGTISAIFQAGYAMMMPLAGRLIDWLGLRVGYSSATLVWSISSLCHSLAKTGGQFSLARFCLGLGEAANFPACIKAVADWFPRRERALATGIFNGGSNLGAILAPLTIPVVTARFGWQAAFLFTGSLSLSFVIVWALVYREPEEHKRLSAKELAFIRSDQEGTTTNKVPYRQLIGTKAAWAFVTGKFLTDPVWWFYLTWLPNFLHNKFGLDLLHLGAPLVTIYAASAGGSITGGWLSSFFLKRGWSSGTARKSAMLVCALAVTAVIFVPKASGNLWLAVGLIAIAAAAHQGWSANLFTVTSDCFPRQAVGSVVGLGGLGGAIGGVLMQFAIGKWLDLSGSSYSPIFIWAGTMYLLSLLLIHLLLPRYESCFPLAP